MASPINTIRDLLLVLQTSAVAAILAAHPLIAPFLFQKIGYILAISRVLPGLEGVTEVSGKNANKGFAKITNFPRDVLGSKIKDGNADGKSDCTFRMGPRSFITSAKLREGDGVDIAKDMEALNTLRLTRPEFKDSSSVLFVRNRRRWIDAHERAHTKELFPIDYAYVYDIEMFEVATLELRRILSAHDNSLDDYAVRYLPYTKTLLTPKFHQHLGENAYVQGGVFLFAMKCRAGKTVSSAHNILCNRFRTVLYITPVPSETKNPTIDTFRRYSQFDGYDVINLAAGVTITHPLTKPTIVVTSKQYLDKHHGDPDIKATRFDAVYQDEIHWAGLTDLNSQVRRNVIRDDTSLILMSGTGEKARVEFGIDNEHVFYWNIEDEAACKRGDIASLETTFGEAAVAHALALSYPGTGIDYADALKKTYAEMPRMRQLITKLKPDFLKNFAMCLERDQYSFDMKELFRMENGALVNATAVLRFFKSYLGSSDGTVMHSTMDTIRALGGRTGNVGKKHYLDGGGATQLWFLPEQVAGGSLDSLSTVIKALLDEHFPEYRTIKVNSSAKLDTREGLEKFIAEQEKIAIEAGKEGLIVLLGRMMAMGVSLPRADIVCMFNNLSKIDLYIQESMRCLTQDMGKTEGIVVDFNQKRVLEASMALVPRSTGTGREIIDRMTKVIAFGAGSFETKDITDIVSHFNKIWTTHSFDKVKVLSARLNNFVGALTVTAEEQKEIMTSSWIRSSAGAPRERLALLSEDERIADAVPEPASPASRDTEASIEPEILEDIIPNFSHEVLTTIPPFVAFLTYGHKREEFIGDLLRMIQGDPIINEIFREQCGTWWKGTKSINFAALLINIFGRCDSKAGRGISSIMSALKSEMESLIDDMHATLAFLNDILAPKESEKKEYGEVFTPEWFADEMLSTLPACEWSNPAATFYDPSAGSGVFGVCVYYRLFDGLASAIPDPVARKTHILTKMLYMSELGTKNVAILRHIFGPLANIYHGDSLSFDAATHWKIRMADVYVIGNPPYNKERSRSGASPLYNEFVDKYINDCRALLFVVPSRWFAGGKGLDKFRAMMLARKDIRFIRHIDDETSVFGSGVSIKGGVNYFMVERGYVGDCEYNGRLMDLSTLDVLVDSRFIPLIAKMTEHPSITTIYRPSGEYKIRTNGKLNGVSVLCDDPSMTPCYVSKQNGFLKYIDPSIAPVSSRSWKVVTPRAAHGHGSGFGSKFIGDVSAIHTDSYISFNVPSQAEAASLASYLDCRLPNKLLSLRKCSQDISANTCKWIPLPPLDRVWADEAVAAYYKLTPEEIALLA
jgi:site-specific DNA-methyltransferase (adenine-specific)